jgi:hypothetical protein
MSSHKKKSNKQQEHVDFSCQNRYNKYLQREKKTKNKAKRIFIFSCFLLNKRQEEEKKNCSMKIKT